MSQSEGYLNGTHRAVKTDLFGRSYSYEIIEAELPEEVYLLHQGVCPCQNHSSICSAPVIPEKEYPSLDITQLTEDEWFEVNGTTRLKYYKFNILPVGGACPVVVISVDTISGSPPNIVVAVGELPTKHNQVAASFYYLHHDIYICDFKFSYGTYYIEASPFTWNIFTSYKIRFYTMDPLPCVPPKPVPYPSDGSFEWLQDGTPSYAVGKVSEIISYRFFVDQPCAIITASVSKTTNEGDVDISLDLENPKASGKAAKWTSATDDDDYIAISYCHHNSSWVLYVGISVWLGSETTPFVTVITTRIFNPRALTDYTYNKLAIALSWGVASLNCPNFTELCNYPPYEDCQFDRGDYFGCCHSFFSLAPTTTPNPIFPWNGADPSYKWVDRIPWNDPLPILPKKLSWALLIGHTTATSVHYKYSRPPDLSQCEIHFNNLLVLENGMPFEVPIRLTPKEQSCDVDDFNEVNTKMNQIVNQMNGVEDIIGLSLLHAKLAILNLEEVVSDCQQLILNATSYKTKEIPFSHVTECLEDVPDDHQCCPLQDSLDSCCLPYTYYLEEKIYQIDSSSSSSCVEKKTQDFIYLLNTMNQCGADFEDTNFLDLDTLKSFLVNCRNGIVGPTATGVPCLQDSDCLTSCNPITNLCDHNDTLVLQCFANNIDQLLMRILRNIWGSNDTSTDRNGFVKTFEKYLIQPLCSGPTGIKYQDHYEFTSPELCNDCVEPLCFDTSCDIPLGCTYEFSKCQRYWTFVPGNPFKCTLEDSCNWMDCSTIPYNVSCSQVCLNASLSEYVCLDCSSGNCVELIGYDEEMCSEGLCSLPQYPARECLLHNDCSIPCPNCTRQQCEQLGACSDFDQIRTLMAKYNGTEGLCITKLHNDFSTPYCDDDEAFFAYGCGDSRYQNETSCIDAGGVWRTPAFTEKECLSFQIDNATEGVYSPTLASFIRVPLSEGIQCGLINQSYVTWTKATWKPAKIQKLLYTRRSYHNTNFIRNTIDYYFFEQSIDLAIGNLYSYVFVNHALCRYQQLNSMVSDIFCLDNQNCDSTSITSVTQSGFGLACSDIGGFIKNDFAEVKIYPNSLALSCNGVSLFTIPSSAFQNAQPTRLSSEIFKPPIPNPLSVVRNRHTNIVGQIVSDGLSIQIDQQVLFFQAPAQLCFYLNKNQFLEAKEYSTYGIGFLKEDQIYVKTTDITETELKFCGNISSTGTYFGIKIYDNWEHVFGYEESTVMESYACTAIYLFVLIATIIQFLLLLILKDENFGVKAYNLVLLIIFLSTRVAYMSLFTYNFGSANTPLFLFEFPSLIFFIIYLSVLYIWLNVLTQIELLGLESNIPLILYVCANLVISLLFTVFVVIFYQQPEFNKIQPCERNAVLYASKERSYVNFIYDLIIAGILLIIAILFVILGLLFLRKIMLFPHPSISYLRLFYSTIILVTCFAICFLTRSIWTVVSLLYSHTPSLVGMTILETVPCLGLALYLYPPDVARRHITLRQNPENTQPSILSDQEKRFK
eukprot:TRINITY_DN15786_c0_g1_i1.p1 TRINITY_DN15786_c0_g1~~TRINITY_DN15786_c0_g1_i1.p1  ORF type:complete len:1501 (-),score=283.36 TRINITY_DN15786_c0_g1_i1:33-4535(-)